MTARRDREIHARIIQHPFGVIGPCFARGLAEQLAVKLNAGGKIGDCNLYMKSFHYQLL
ncbi:MAG: hypothetical protein HY080_14310 [Gammaproteobacteria bacterium]|nr:hypothetical protein [Gammaproteobacteria bacterium]